MPSTAKADLRRRVRAALRALSPAERQAASAAAADRLYELAPWQAARQLMVFLSLGWEIDTTAVVERAWREGRRVLVPWVDPDRRVMAAAEIASWSDVELGHFGVREPRRRPPLAVAEIDLLVMPGLAFDDRGHRLGQGAAYYDTFLAASDCRAVRCAFAFECQVVEAVPTEPHDQPLDWLVTEAGVRRFENTSRS